MSLPASSSVIADQTAMHAAIALADPSWQIPPAGTLRSLFDVVFDWTIIYVTAWAEYRVGACIMVLTIFIIGNRQRALGNLLHEAGHQNLSAQRNVNDWIGHFMLAPALLANLTVYRVQHARHHAWLGDPLRDPDYLPRVPNNPRHWFEVYARMAGNASIWVGSLLGHLAGKRLSLARRFTIILWWTAHESVLCLFVSRHFALLFLAIWITAKATVFHGRDQI